MKNSFYSVIIFRLREKWFALPLMHLKEVLPFHPIHRVPHANEKIFLGLVNVDGELQRCFTLYHLLLNPSLSLEFSHSLYQQRMIVVEWEKEIWLFPVDEIGGIKKWREKDLILPANSVSYDKKEVQNKEQTSSAAAQFQSDNVFIKAIMHQESQIISLLDTKKLFAHLKQEVE